MRIQSNLGSDIAMAFDGSASRYPSPYEYVRQRLRQDGPLAQALQKSPYGV